MPQNISKHQIEFFFDFSSPYAYFASSSIEAIAARHGREVIWRPILLGALFKLTGGRPLTEIPFKSTYTLNDLPRCARRLGLPFRMPAPFPFASITACRAFYWVDQVDTEAARKLAKTLLRQAFGEGGDISSPRSVVRIAEGLGHDAEAVGAALKDPEIKAHLLAVVDLAVEREVFGSPFFFADGEPFWGHDRLDMLEAWIESGGW